ncbi:glutaredoxin family protein [Bacillus paranthracis]|uniref:glutaredoxin family protein n=1 Tax=Bacillus paranthracis TaxID=2026186 RepID=UPI0013D4C0AE|nr:glutaredoxin [Bacillus paranthracis]
MATKITMFTKNNCPNCMRAKMLFASCPVEVEITEINLETPEGKAHQEILGIQTAPTFEFENGKFIYGFDEGKLINELGL